jgi:hypothetical protein
MIPVAEEGKSVLRNIRRILTREEVRETLSVMTFVGEEEPDAPRLAVAERDRVMDLYDQGKVLAYEDESGAVVFEPIVAH